MIGRCEIKFHKFKDRLEEALSLSASQSVNGLDSGHSLNRQVGISWRSARFSGQFIGRPILDGLRTDPDGEASPFFERGVILAPVADAVCLLLHGRKSISGHCIRNSSLSFVQQSPPELEKRIRPNLRLTNDFYRVDETYIKIKGEWKYLYRAVDSTGQTIDFMLSAKRDARAAKRFFRKMLKAPKHQSPRVINVDQNRSYPPAVEELKEEGVLPVAALLRRCKYLNNIVEQDHRFIKRRVNPGLGFFSFNTARRTIGGYEVMNMIRKGQIEGIGKGDIRGQVRFVADLFNVAA
jgi:transposase, IS6 family